MPPLPAPAAVLFVADVRRMTKFYVGLAGMRMLHDDTDHAVLELAGFQLVIHSLRGESAPPHPVTIREDSHTKICFPVTRIAEARARAESLGGMILPVEKEWEARGFRACDGHDPEGNVIQVREGLA